MWLVFLALHLIGLTGYNLLLRKSIVAKSDRWTLATVMQTGIAIPMLVALLLKPPDLSVYTPEIILKLGLIVIGIIALHLTNVKSLQYLEAGVYSVLFNLRIIFATILGVVFLNEPVVPLQILGGFCILLAIIAVKQKGNKHRTLVGIGWGVAAALAISFLNLGEKSVLGNIDYLAYAIPTALISAVIMWIVLLLRRTPIQLSSFTSSGAVTLMVFRALSMYGATLALFVGASLSVATYVSSLSVIATVILGMTVLGETDYRKQKIIATSIAVVGLTLILLTNL